MPRGVNKAIETAIIVLPDSKTKLLQITLTKRATVNLANGHHNTINILKADATKALKWLETKENE